MKSGEAQKKKLMMEAKTLLKERGEKAYKSAKDAILGETIGNKEVSDALKFFMEESWFDFQHPAVLSLACEAVGGDPTITTYVGAAMVLLAGSADIHDDIIDKSKTKGGILTVFGKFGKDIALLTGDALLFKGVTSMCEACEKLPEKERRKILDLTRQSFFEIGSAEATEAGLRGDLDLTPEEYYDVIEKKAKVAEANARIGAILGGGTRGEIDALGHYAKTLGMLVTIRDDFIDLYEPEELANRVKNECLPLPLLYAFKNEKKKEQILRILEKDGITEQDTNEILDLIMETEEVEELRDEMRSLLKKGKDSIKHLGRSRDSLMFLLEAALEGL
jgi:geranylgeranyl pyrophosphate synthase